MAESSIRSAEYNSPWTGAERRVGARRANAWRIIPEAGMPAAPEPVELSPASEPAPEAKISFDEFDLARACAAVATSVRAAEAQATQDCSERRIADALEHIATAISGADTVLAELRQKFREGAVTLAACATEALAMGPGVKVVARLADALAADCLARFAPDLELTIEVAPDIADALAARLAALPVVKARSGRVAVEAVSTLGPGEARLVWQDGAADWSIQRLHNDAAALVRRLIEPAEPTRSNESDRA